MFENLNLRPLNYSNVMNFLKKHKKSLIPLYKEIYKAKKLHPYWKRMETHIQSIGKEYGKEVRIHFHHGGF